jgi:hypothetical protein
LLAHRAALYLAARARRGNQLTIACGFMKPRSAVSKNLLLPLVLVALAPGALEAQVRIDSPYRWVDPGMSANVFAGHMVTGRTVVDAGPKDALFWGGRYSLRVSGPFTAEIDVAFMPAQRPVRDTAHVDGGGAELGEARASIGMLLGGLRFNLPGPRTWYGLQPYALFGGGLTRDFAGRTELEEDVPETARFRFGTSFAGQLGAGVEWFATPRVAVRGDARNVIWRLRNPDFYRAQPDVEFTVPPNEWISNYAFSAGLSLYF